MKKIFPIAAAALLLLTASAGVSLAQSASRIEAEKEFVEAQKALARGDDKTAESCLMKSLRLDAGFTSAIWQLAQIYEKRGQLEHARELIIRGLQQEPDASWARDKLSQVERVLTGRLMSSADNYMNSGQYDLALPKLSLYLGIKPHDPAPLVKMGRCHLALGNLEGAREYLVQAVQRDPSNTEATTLLEDVDRRVERSEIESLVETAKSILAGPAPDRSGRARAALTAVLEKDPYNEWARAMLRELSDAESAAMKKAAQTASPAPEEKSGAKETAGPEESRSSAGSSMDPLGYMLVLAAIAAVALLALNLRRRTRMQSYPLQGTLSLIPVLDIVSLLNANLKSGRLSVVSGKDRGEIFFEKGEIVHARFTGMDGKTAFHRIMDLKSGKYIFYNHLPNIRHTITEPLSLLLLSMKSVEEPPKAGARRPKKEKVPASV